MSTPKKPAGQKPPVNPEPKAEPTPEAHSPMNGRLNFQEPSNAYKARFTVQEDEAFAPLDDGDARKIGRKVDLMNMAETFAIHMLRQGVRKKDYDFVLQRVKDFLR